MPDGKPGRANKPAERPSRSRAPAPRQRAVAEVAPSTRRPAQSDVRRLAAEVERLEAALAAAQAQMAELAERADIDPLTELPNRRAFERELSRALAYIKRHGTPAALLYLDLDGFKRVNDRHGHAAGDAVLRAVARVLARHVRASDLVARIGGDEFVLLLWNCDEGNAFAKARVLEDAVGRTTAMHAGTALAVAASIGAAALLPLDRPADILDRADRAMYARKNEASINERPRAAG